MEEEDDGSKKKLVYYILKTLAEPFLFLLDSARTFRY
jgi:hypothetical protein